MKKFKKSEIAIYAIALMLVAAGYFNYTTFENETQETYSEDIENIEQEYANVGDAVLVSNNEQSTETNEQINTSNTTNTLNNEQQENEEVKQVSQDIEQNTQAEDSKNPQTENTVNENDYYATSKLDREKMYAEMLSNYESILNNQNVSEAQKSIATQEITKINNTKNAIMICENLILTKGFNNCIIFVNEQSVNAVVNVNDGLNKENVAKIQNIIARELAVGIENIHITEK